MRFFLIEGAVSKNIFALFKYDEFGANTNMFLQIYNMNCGFFSLFL